MLVFLSVHATCMRELILLIALADCAKKTFELSLSTADTDTGKAWNR